MKPEPSRKAAELLSYNPVASGTSSSHPAPWLPSYLGLQEKVPCGLSQSAIPITHSGAELRCWASRLTSHCNSRDQKSTTRQQPQGSRLQSSASPAQLTKEHAEAHVSGSGLFLRGDIFLANSTLPLLLSVLSLALLQRGCRSRAAPQVPAHCHQWFQLLCSSGSH